ncbi:acyltransferase family protein [Pseudomonas marginalis]|uniref:acyltransferase family protein n=1 Tax=Pseudomonas marginalis TaxID=298 RepID=UPI002A361270|nr:acyltransferase [Pseudomonas marginalis]WPN21789.1 acyltransferase [Pseudomonas marginalis]
MPLAKSRDVLLDAMKGMAILLVVLGHSIQSYYLEFDNNLWFRVIYSFHMPLFMFLSGWVSFYSSRTDVLDFFVSRSQRLVLPFVAWYLFSYIFNGGVVSGGLVIYIKTLLISPDAGLWFLWVLFLCQVILYFCLRLAAKVARTERALLIIVAVAIVLVNAAKFHGAGVDLLKEYLIYFMSGYLLSRHKEVYASWSIWVLSPCVLAFPLLVQFWHRTSGPQFPLTVLELIGRGRLFRMIESGYLVATAMAGIGFTFMVVWLLISCSHRIGRPLGFLGARTLDIYAIHFYFVAVVGFGIGWQRSITAFFVSLILTLAVSWLMRKSEFLKFVFLGERTRRPKLLPFAER